MEMIKRSSMALFSGPTDIYSHQVRIALAEKAVAAEVVPVEDHEPPEDFQELNPEMTLPTLVDRDLVLTDATIIMEYLDERFPHPPLLPVYPVCKAKTRLLMRRMERDWYRLALNIEAGRDVEASRQGLIQHFLRVMPLFEDMPFFLSQEFSMVDCVLAPLMWRLPVYGITLPEGCEPMQAYIDRVFSRVSFQASLTPEELDVREEEDVEF